jgi:hypothetical protein
MQVIRKQLIYDFFLIPIQEIRAGKASEAG